LGKTALVALLLALLLLGALQAVNGFYVGVTTQSVAAAARALALLVGCVVAACFTWLASARAGREVRPSILGAALLGLVGIGYAGFLAFVPVHRFGSAITEPPSTIIEENYPRRGRHTYRTNSLGFRGPEWNPTKAPETLRGVVIGDSMVFGCGVDDEDTIDATLARRLRRTHPGARVEVLNLGVEGANLRGYVELYRTAEERLAPDFAVLFLFLPNDFGELEQPEGDRPGGYSFFTFLLGTNNNPYTMHLMSASQTRSEESQLAFLGHHLRAIAAIRRAFPASRLFVFLYHDDVPAWGTTVRAALGEGGSLVDHERLPDEDFIADDGHPTPAGNRHFAEILGDAIDRWH